MEINQEQLKTLIKATVKEALTEFFKDNEASKKPEQKQTKAIPTYDEMFHRIMAQAARGEIDAQTAGKLVAEAYQAFGSASDTPPPNQKESEASSTKEPLNDILSRVSQWEAELSTLTGQAAESTLEMMERMRERLEKETNEAKMYMESKKIEKEEAQRKAAEDLKAMKEKLAAEDRDKRK